MIQTMSQPHPPEQFLGPLIAFSQADPTKHQRQSHILQGGQGGQQVEGLKNETDIDDGGDALSSSSLAVLQRQTLHVDLAAGRVVQPAQQIQQR